MACMFRVIPRSLSVHRTAKATAASRLPVKPRDAAVLIILLISLLQADDAVNYRYDSVYRYDAAEIVKFVF